MNRLTLTFTLILIVASFGQRMKENLTSFQCISLPLEPLPLHLQSYDVAISYNSYDHVDSLREFHTEDEFHYLLQIEEWDSHITYSDDFPEETTEEVQIEEESSAFPSIMKMVGLGLAIALAEDNSDRAKAALQLGRLGLETAADRLPDDTESIFHTTLDLAELGLKLASVLEFDSLESDNYMEGYDYSSEYGEAMEISFDVSPYIPHDYSENELINDSSYIAGFNRNDSSELKLKFDIQGFRFTTPEMDRPIKITYVDKVVTDTVITDTLLADTVVTDTIISNTTVTDSIITYDYRVSFNYRNPVICSVFVDDNLFSTIENTREYLGGMRFETLDSLETWWIDNKQEFIARCDRYAVQNAVDTIFKELNNRHGYTSIQSNVITFIPESRRHSYDDLHEACRLAEAGYLALHNDRDRAEGSKLLSEAIGMWETALKEAQPNERKVRKARINRDVTVAIFLNVIKASIYSNNFDKANAYLSLFSELHTKRDDRKMANNWRYWIKKYQKGFEAREKTRKSGFAYSAIDEYEEENSEK